MGMMAGKGKICRMSANNPASNDKTLAGLLISSKEFSELASSQKALHELSPIAADFSRSIQALRIQIHTETLEANLAPTMRALRLASDAAAEMVSSPAFREGIAIHAEWQSRLHLDFSAAARQMEAALLPYRASLVNVTRAIESHLKTIDFERLGASLIADSSMRIALEPDLNGLASAYSSHLISLKENSVLVVPPAVSIFPPFEVSRHLDLLSEISLEPTRPSVSEYGHEISVRIGEALVERLANLDAGLLSMLRGAKEALASNNLDKHRHAVISVRELVTQVLHLLAPDERVRKWSDNPEHYSRDGRPTRRARISFVTSVVDSPVFSKFVEADLIAAEGVFDLLHKGTHRVETPFTDEQVAALIARVEGLLHFWLELPQS